MNRNPIVRTSYVSSAVLSAESDWRIHSACKDEDPDLFFPVGGLALLEIKEAKAVCSRCPVRDRCLQWALETGEKYGIWGGTDEVERRRMMRRAARKRAAA